jgi:hypothetical protein
MNGSTLESFGDGDADYRDVEESRDEELSGPRSSPSQIMQRVTPEEAPLSDTPDASEVSNPRTLSVIEGLRQAAVDFADWPSQDDKDEMARYIEDLQKRAGSVLEGSDQGEVQKIALIARGRVYRRGR